MYCLTLLICDCGQWNMYIGFYTCTQLCVWVGEGMDVHVHVHVDVSAMHATMPSFLYIG